MLSCPMPTLAPCHSGGRPGNIAPLSAVSALRDGHSAQARPKPMPRMRGLCATSTRPRPCTWPCGAAHTWLWAYWMLRSICAPLRGDHATDRMHQDLNQHFSLLSLLTLERFSVLRVLVYSTRVLYSLQG